MTLELQFQTILTMVSGGFYLGIVLDTFRRLTRRLAKRQLLFAFLEVCFWLTQTFILFFLLFLVNGGELRGYIFVAVLLGFSAYQALAATVYKRLLEWFIRAIIYIYQLFSSIIHAIVILPILFCVKVVWICLRAIVYAVLAIVFFILRVLFAPIKWIFKVIYQRLPVNFQKYLHKLAGFYSTITNIGKEWLKSITFKGRE